MILRPVGDRTGWWIEGAIALFLIAFPALLATFGVGTDLGTRILILGLFGIGVDLIFGYTGLLSFGQAAFYGTGGFVTAHLLITHAIPNSLGALAVGTLVAALFGALVGSLALRQVGIYFAMLTLAFGQLFYFVENSPLRAYTGSENGLPGVPKPSLWLGGTTLDFSSSIGTYAFVAVIYFAGFFIARRIVRSPFGAVLRAIRENPERAQAVGHSIARYKLVAFTIAAAYGGLAGGLLGMFQGYMPPEAFSIDQSGEIIVMTVIGGPGTLIGPLVGSAVWTFLRQVLQNVDIIAGVWKLILGLVFILLITFFRRGLVGGAVALWQRARAPR
jgi:branched-chain amino acid transport system ATP-binding protein/branched-chain amino acid transport system permease protein